MVTTHGGTDDGTDGGVVNGAGRFQGVRDKSGRHFQTYRLNVSTFDGLCSQSVVDSSKPLTAKTKFVNGGDIDDG